jgi:hypothetical protein
MIINNTRLVAIQKIIIKKTYGNERLLHIPLCTNIKQIDDVAFTKRDITENAIQRAEGNRLHKMS